MEDEGRSTTMATKTTTTTATKMPTKKKKTNAPEFQIPNFSKKVKIEKKLYGTEYRIPTLLGNKPQGKLIKLNQPAFEALNIQSGKTLTTKEVTTAATVATTTTSSIENISIWPKAKSHLSDDISSEETNLLSKMENDFYSSTPYPTITRRIAQAISIDPKTLPKFCFECLSSKCICHIIRNKK